MSSNRNEEPYKNPFYIRKAPGSGQYVDEYGRERSVKAPPMQRIEPMVGSSVDIPVTRDPRVNYDIQKGDKMMTCPYDQNHLVLSNRFTAHLTKCQHNYKKALKDGRIKLQDPGEEIVVCVHSFHHHIKMKDRERHETVECDKNVDEDPTMKFLRAQLAAGSEVKKEPEEEESVGWGGDWTPAPVDDRWDRKAKAEEEALKARGEWVERLPEHGNLTKEELMDPEENWEIVYDEKTGGVVPREGAKPGERFAWYNPKENMTKKLGKVFSNPQGLTKSERREYRERQAAAHMKDLEAQGKLAEDPDFDGWAEARPEFPPFPEKKELPTLEESEDEEQQEMPIQVKQEYPNRTKAEIGWPGWSGPQSAQSLNEKPPAPTYSDMASGGYAYSQARQADPGPGPTVKMEMDAGAQVTRENPASGFAAGRGRGRGRVMDDEEAEPRGFDALNRGRGGSIQQDRFHYRY